MKNLVSAFAAIFLIQCAFSQRLDVVSFTSSEKSGFVSCYILTSGKKSILLDAPMSATDAHRLIDTIIRLNRHISGVLITHAHPDHFLGISEIKKAFPSIKVMAVKEVADEINKSGREMYGRLKTLLGDDMPAPLVLPDSIIDNTITLENCTLELRSFHDGESSVTTTLYEPKQKLFFSGDIVYNKVHLYMLEQHLDGWLKELEELKNYRLTELYPGHGLPTTSESIENCVNYIQTFQKALLTNDATAIFDIMNYYFPGYLKPAYLKQSIAKYLTTK